MGLKSGKEQWATKRKQQSINGLRGQHQESGGSFIQENLNYASTTMWMFVTKRPLYTEWQETDHVTIETTSAISWSWKINKRFKPGRLVIIKYKYLYWLVYACIYIAMKRSKSKLFDQRKTVISKWAPAVGERILHRYIDRRNLPDTWVGRDICSTLLLIEFSSHQVSYFNLYLRRKPHGVQAALELAVWSELTLDVSSSRLHFLSVGIVPRAGHWTQGPYMLSGCSTKPSCAFK